MKKSLSILLMLLATLFAQAAPIGSWTSFLAYGDITEIEPAGKMVYVLSSKGLFSYKISDTSVQTYDKMNALNDCNISHIAYCKTAHRLVIIYENQNIDLLDDEGNVFSISDYYNKSMTDDKTINEISISGNHAYLSTNFGILKINVTSAEITSTYNLGKKVMSTAVYNGYIYAACGDQGIIKGNTTHNLLDKNNWTTESTLSADYLFNYNNQLIAATNGVVYVKKEDWEKVADFSFSFCNNTGGKLIFGNADSVLIFDNLSTSQVIQHDRYALKTLAYDDTNHCYWSHQKDNKLYSLSIENKEIIPNLINICPDGPKYNYFGFMRYQDNTLYTCGGGFDSFAELNREATVQTFNNDLWTIYQDDDEMKAQFRNRFQDMTCLDVDPKDKTHVMVGGRTGLYEYKEGQFVHKYDAENSPLMHGTDNNSPNYVLTLGIKYDKEGNLWCLNSLAQEASILKLKTDGTWESHHKEILMDDNNRSLPNMKCLILDSRGLFWFVNNHWSIPSFYCFDPSNDGINYYNSFINEDGTKIIPTGVRCIMEDNEGNIWIGTNVGPLMLPSNDISEGSNAVLQQVKVPRNDGTNFADYLLSGVDISCMAVDGGNRKWFGSNGNGVYLISSDNLSQIHHFTSDNSELLSDNIESITIDHSTGEVFFGTDNGLCSFMSDATAPAESMSKDFVYAYPNPVTPDYTGLITVTGLTVDADVKIVTANGALVAQGTSNGGLFTWDGCDKNGHRVASGVYMVVTATNDGKKGTVCKIAIVN